ncbi:MAG: hypothetical protein GKR89_02575 [Candidatus Latescibacteria bacterium]|nr:hypothetical protein [Candidatus Latescibacterota bacterium]
MSTNLGREFIEPLRAYTEAVFQRCAWTGTPLLADGINLGTGAPLEWEGAVPSNLACQMNFLRLLEGLAVTTGQQEYHARADDWIGRALPLVRDPASDLLHWGGHTSYDLRAGQVLLGNHELKCVYPHYAYLYRVDPQATRRFVEAFWQAHIWDWSSLLFNRHGEYESWDRSGLWRGEYKGGPLPIVENTALSFINTGSDLICAGALLHQLGGDSEPLQWALHLLGRYDQIRHPETGLAGYQFNHREPCRVRESFKEPLGSRREINETTVVTNNVITTRYGRAAVAFLNLFAALGEKAGAPFRDLVVADLQALSRHAWDDSSGAFMPLLNDGQRLDPGQSQEGVGYCPPAKLQPVAANGLLFLAYARAFRLTGMEEFRGMAATLAAAMGWGDLDRAVDFSGPVSPHTQDQWAPAGQNDACALFGLLDLHAASGDQVLLQSALSLGRRLLEVYSCDGFFRTGGGDQAHIDGALPLALVHLAAALDGGAEGLPAFYPNNTYFDPKIVIRRQAG